MTLTFGKKNGLNGLNVCINYGAVPKIGGERRRRTKGTTIKLSSFISILLSASTPIIANDGILCGVKLS